MTRLLTIILVGLVVLLLVGCSIANEKNNNGGTIEDRDEVQIYAEAIRQIYYVDHSFGEAPGWPLVYAVSTTNDSAMIDGPTAPSRALKLEVQEAISQELGDEPFELIWIEKFEDAPVNPENGAVAHGEGIIITLGNIHPQEEGSVQLPFFMTCGGLCGIGKIYVIEQVNDSWQITGSTGPLIMS